MAEKEYIERGAVLRLISDQIEETDNHKETSMPISYGCMLGLKYAHSIVSTSPAADVMEGSVKKCDFCTQYTSKGNCLCEGFFFNQADRKYYCEKAIARMEKAMRKGDTKQ